jgi:pimeloyl-ACP methyl ester carboxylesterase
VDTVTTTGPASLTKHRFLEVDGLDIFYREAGDPDNSALVLLHGFPTSSQMYRNLIAKLADRYHLVAPDYPSFGHSAFPSAEDFDYSFESFYELILNFIDKFGLIRFSIYIQDYGAPIGLRLAQRNQDRIEAIITQSGNAYLDGFTPFWEPLFAYATDPNPQTESDVRKYLTHEANKWQWTHGTRDPENISPDTWTLDDANLDRPGNREIQLKLFRDYKNNLDGYPAFQQYFRDRQPPTLIVWGRNDEIFGPKGAEAYLRDLPNAELHLLDTGHFALEEECDFIAQKICEFLDRHVG